MNPLPYKTNFLPLELQGVGLRKIRCLGGDCSAGSYFPWLLLDACWKMCKIEKGTCHCPK